MYLIAKTFEFSAAHQLVGLAADHPCMRVHGHNYEVTLSLQCRELDDVGMVLDYRSLDRFKADLDTLFDHQSLNETMGVNPTAENLAVFVFRFARSFIGVRRNGGSLITVQSVSVKETRKTSATYAPES